MLDNHQLFMASMHYWVHLPSCKLRTERMILAYAEKKQIADRNQAPLQQRGQYRNILLELTDSLFIEKKPKDALRRKASTMEQH
jgi:hypothetical protein